MMQEQTADEHRVFLSTLPAERRDRRLALAVALVSLAIFLAAAPFAKLQLAPVPAFIPIIASTLVINDLITAVLLFGQFVFLRSWALLVLAGGYLFTASMTVAHALTFPGVFSPTGLLGAGQHSTAWLYIFWHSGFPLLVVAYALLKDERRETNLLRGHLLRGRAGVAISAGVAAVLVAVCGLTLFATAWEGVLPALMQGNHIATQGHIFLSSVWMLSLVALAVLWRKRPHSVLDLWLMVVMCAWIFDIALSAVLNAGRFDLGFYAGRVYGLLAASFVLIVLLLENGKLYARLVVAHGSERRERRLAQEKSAALAALNKELDAFTYSVSHDLRAPLRAIDGFATILEEDFFERMDPEARRILGVVRANTRQMSQMTEDLLAFARLGRQPLRTQPVRPAELANEVIADQRITFADRSIEFNVGDLGTAQADPALLKQALANLIGNAVKYTRGRYPALVEVGYQSAQAEDDPIVYYVKDNGAGFDMRHSDRLFGVFQRFHTQKEFEGTGVGLAIVERIISRHGGRVWAESRPGEGAIFFFTLQPGSAKDAGTAVQGA
ncbi:MAG TPA: MASE4 domain-containing protein [Burkholderiales bacterium]|nr:MASE4 domain-containing protein [Burkholderiales bacterium]